MRLRELPLLGKGGSELDPLELDEALLLKPDCELLLPLDLLDPEDDTLLEFDELLSELDDAD